MRRLRGISLFAIVLALATSGHAVAQSAPAAQQGSGQICVVAFNDQNGNGVREADEPLLAGISFTLVDNAVVKDSYQSDGVSESYCFGSLAAGGYTVQARGAGSLEVTTAGQWAISLANGAQYDVDYGARQAGSGSAQPAAGSMSDLGRVVLGVVGAAVLAGAGLLVRTAWQRARDNR